MIATISCAILVLFSKVALRWMLQAIIKSGNCLSLDRIADWAVVWQHARDLHHFSLWRPHNQQIILLCTIREGITFRPGAVWVRRKL